MKTLITTLFLSFITFFAGFAQEFVFKVMANNGSNMFRTVSNSDWSPVRRGVALNTGDIVRIADRAYLGLIHNSGRTVELIDPGTFKIDEIELNIDIRKKGIGGKYTEFVMNTIDNSTDLDESGTLVTRGAEKKINVEMPYASEVYGKSQIINWSGSSDINSYILTVRGIFDDVLLEVEVDQTQYKLDLNHPALKDERMFVISISEKNQEQGSSPQYSIDLLSDSKYDQYRQELESIKENLRDDSPLDHVVLAYYFEENGLLLDAISSYQRAIRLAPGVDDFKQQFRAFKARHSIN